MIGNAVERGIGLGPLGDRVAHMCALEVVLPSGELIRTGWDRFDGAAATHVWRGSVRPLLDGLFVQSSLGVVVRMTQWLARRPSFAVGIPIATDRSLADLLDGIREVIARGLVRHPIVIWNAYRMFSRPCSTLGATPSALRCRTATATRCAAISACDDGTESSR